MPQVPKLKVHCHSLPAGDDLLVSPVSKEKTDLVNTKVHYPLSDKEGGVTTTFFASPEGKKEQVEVVLPVKSSCGHN